jgi:phage terminase large subunit-like protein
MGEMSVLDRTGDTKILWDAGNADEVSNAKRTFDDLKKKGFSIFSVKRSGDRGTRVDEFDPALESLIAVPRVVGG